MIKKIYIIRGFISLIIFIVGLVLGLIWKDLPYIKLNSEVKLYEIANVLITIVIGITVPLLVKKWIEDHRSVKSSLVEEVKNVILIINKINSLIDNCHSAGSITKENKDEINYLFHKSELQINSLDEQLKISFEALSSKLTESLKKNYYIYKDYLTGGELMVSSFTKIDGRFYREHNNEHSKIETFLKTLIHKIHKL